MRRRPVLERVGQEGVLRALLLLGDPERLKFPNIYSHATSDEHFGLMTSRLKRTIIGHSLVCRSHGVALHAQRLM